MEIIKKGSKGDAVKTLQRALGIGWEIWSCLENESSCNGAKWAMILQQIMVDKTERHFDLNLSALKKEK